METVVQGIVLLSLGIRGGGEELVPGTPSHPMQMSADAAVPYIKWHSAGSLHLHRCGGLTVSGDRHSMEKIRAPSTLWAPPGCGYSAPYRETSRPGFLLCLLQCQRNLSGQESPGVSMGNPLGFSENKHHQNALTGRGWDGMNTFCYRLDIEFYSLEGQPQLFHSSCFPSSLKTCSTQQVFLFTSLFSCPSVLGLDFFPIKVSLSWVSFSLKSFWIQILDWTMTWSVTLLR